ncbi:DNA-binding transcriptional activator GcvA [compost metagenome]
MVSDELARGSLVIPWDYAMPSAGAHFIAHAEHAGEVPKVKAFLRWMVTYITPA